MRRLPILLTGLTTMAALLPVAMGISVGSRIFQPFAVTVIDGLIRGMAATLLVLPVAAFTVQGQSGPPERADAADTERARAL